MRGSKPGERRGGRARGTPNKLTTESKKRLKEMLDPHVPTSINAIVKNLSNGDPMVRQRAAESILDRFYGRPGQSIMFGDDDPDAAEPRNEIVVRFIKPNHKDAK